MPGKKDMTMGLLGAGGCNSGNEIDIASEELDDLLRQVEAGIDGVGGMGGSERSSKIKSLKSNMTRAKNVLHGMKVELQDVDSRERPSYEKKIAEYKKKYDVTFKMLQQSANSQNRTELLAGQSPRDGGGKDQSGAQMLDEAQNIQNQDKKATKRMLRQLEQTKELGANTMESMKAQTDQITRVHQGLDEIDSTLNLATAQIRQFTRKMATDKLIMGFLFLVVCGIVTIIALKMFGVLKSDTVNLPDQPTSLN